MRVCAALSAIVLASQVLAQAPATPVGQPLTPPGSQPPAQQPPGQTVPFTPVQNPPGQPVNRVPIPGAEAPGAPAVAAPAQVDPVLLGHLQGWDKVMQGATNFYAQFSLQEKITQPIPKVKQSSGSMMCLKPNMARMRLDIKLQPGQTGTGNEFEAYICNGKAVYHYEGPIQTVTIYPIANGVGENLLLELMSGQLRANDILRRFEAKIIKQDQFYVYLELLPKLPRDKQEFNSMTLVLFQPTLPKVGYLPRTVLVRKDNGKREEVWDFPEPAINVDGIKIALFDYVPPAKGWKIQQMQAPPSGNPPMNPMGQVGQPGGAGGPVVPVSRPKN